MKNKIKTICIIIFSIGMVWTANTFAADAISVLKVDTLVMEKGRENYSVTVKAFVKNKGVADNFAVNVVGVDMNGYELQNATLSGFLKEGQTKVLVSVVKIPKAVYTEIVRWEWKK